MTPEKWENIKGNIKDGFSVKDEGLVHLDEEGGMDIEFIEFDGPLGQMRLEFIIKPLVIDKKTTYSRRIGSETKVKYVYSETEKNYLFKAYKWDEEQNDWKEVEAAAFA